MKSSRYDRGAILLMTVTVTIWGVNWIVMKHLSAFIGPFDLVALRCILGAMILFLMLFASKQSLHFPPSVGFILAIAVFQTAFQCLSQFALISGGAGQVVMLAYTMPFWVVLFAWIFLGDRPTQWHVVGFTLAALGLLAVIAPWEGLGTLLSSLSALGSGVTWGFSTVLIKMLFQRHKMNVLNLTAWQLLLSAAMTLPLAMVIPQPAIDWQPDLIWGLGYMAILASAVGWWLWLAVVRRVSATVAGMSSLGVPVLAVILAWAILGERPSQLELIGIFFLMAGLVVVNLAPAQRKRAVGAQR